MKLIYVVCKFCKGTGEILGRKCKYCRGQGQIAVKVEDEEEKEECLSGLETEQSY